MLPTLRTQGTPRHGWQRHLHHSKYLKHLVAAGLIHLLSYCLPHHRYNHQYCDRKQVSYRYSQNNH